MAVTGDEFLSSVKRLVTVPASQKLLQDADILAFADRRTLDTLVPLLDGVNQDYFLTSSTEAIVSGTAAYRLPARAIARKLRDLKIVSPSGGRSNCTKIQVEREHLHSGTANSYGFYFRGDKVQLLPTPSVDGYSLEWWWFLGPSRIVKTAAAARVSLITGDTVTVNSLPATIVAQSEVDFVGAKGGNSCLEIDKQIQVVNGTDLIFATDAVPTDLAVGDYIALSGYSPIIQLPDCSIPLLETLTAMDILNAIGDFDGESKLEERRKKQEENLTKILEPRIEGEPEIILGRRNRRKTFGWLQS